MSYTEEQFDVEKILGKRIQNEKVIFKVKTTCQNIFPVTFLIRLVIHIWQIFHSI